MSLYGCGVKEKPEPKWNSETSLGVLVCGVIMGPKAKIVGQYPKPTKDKIIEPFAGTAQYALKYFDREIEIYDKYELIVNLFEVATEM